jgi:UDP-GlcNAc:undecaprenyl-phosphate GlcNAc-1-phosphate transferase
VLGDPGEIKWKLFESGLHEVLGLTWREAVLTCYLIGGACGLVAVYIAQARFPDGYIAAGLLALAGLAGIIWLERICPSGVPRKTD